MNETQADIILRHLRSLGDMFLSLFRSSPIPVTLDETFALFRSIEDKSTEFLTERLRAEFPGTPFAEGEFDLNVQKTIPSQGEFWVFDSMDGAVQYMRHLPGWTFNLALMREGRPVFAVIYDPLHGEMYRASAGDGAYLNDSKLRAAPRAESKFFMASTAHPPFPDRHPGLIDRIAVNDAKLLTEYAFLRNFGPTALQIAYVAAGRMDVFCAEGLDTFNWIPGVLIAREAGAQVLDGEGRPWAWGAESLFVAGAGYRPPGA